MLRLFAFLTLCLALPALAEVPRVVTDIRPVHSLVAMVMEDVGVPTVLLPANASPHSYALRPSEAAALETANLVVWVGPGLTPWLERPIQQIAGAAKIVTLLDLAPVKREIAGGHDDHDGHGDEHDDHGDIDPHAWLDPMNAAYWVGDIADALSEIDPDNAASYRQNAARASARLRDLQETMAETLADIRTKSYAVHHDAYGYLEGRFGLSHRFAVIDSHAREPGPARIAKLRESVRVEDISCILTDGIEGSDLLQTVIEGHHAKVLQVDPTGAGIAPGPLLYMDLMSGISLIMADC